MLRRNFRHTLRNPGAMIMTIGMPVVLLLLFVCVFGGALNVGLGVEATRRRLHRLRGARASS